MLGAEVSGEAEPHHSVRRQAAGPDRHFQLVLDLIATFEARE